MSTDLALLILRLVVGLTIAAHGAQKLFGWFGGRGFGGALQMAHGQRLRPAPLWAVVAGLSDPPVSRRGGGTLWHKPCRDR